GAAGSVGAGCAIACSVQLATAVRQYMESEAAATTREPPRPLTTHPRGGYSPGRCRLSCPPRPRSSACKASGAAPPAASCSPTDSSRGASSPRRPTSSPAGSRAAAWAPGTPKGVMLTHENFLWATLACGQARGDTADSIGACLSPLTHTPVLVSHLLCRVLAGSSAVLFERFDLGTVLEAVERHGISDLS